MHRYFWLMLSDREGVQKDINETVIWYKCQEKGNPLAYASLAQIYLENKDGLGNMKEA